MMWTRLILLVSVPALTVLACGGDGGSGVAPSGVTMVPVTSAPSGSASQVTTTDSTTTAPATTVRPATTVPSASVAPVTTARPVTTSSSIGGVPCDIDVIIEQTQSFVQGVTPTSLRCAEDWASWSGQPDDPMAMDGYFAVAQWTGASWELRNLGTAGICGDGGVPLSLWPALDCVE
jgi:hypothetical protein